MNVLIRCLDAVVASTQRVAQNPGDYYANKDAARRAWAAALKSLDSEVPRVSRQWIDSRKIMEERLEAASYVGD